MPLIETYISEDENVDRLYQLLKSSLTKRQLLDLGTKIAMQH